MAVVKIPRIIELARRLEEDIHERGLTAGEPYLNAAEAARMLKVSTSTANRALQVLSQRKIVERGQRRGTFVSDLSGEASLSTIRRVQVVYFEYTGERGGQISDEILIGLQQEVPYALIQFNFVPAIDDRRHFGSLLEEAIESNEPVGIVLVRAPFFAQSSLAEAAAENEIAALVLGNSYESTGLPWLNADFRVAADLVVEHLRQTGAKRITYLAAERGLLPGDVRFLDRLREQLSTHGFGLEALRWVAAPSDEAEMRAVLAGELGSPAEDTLYYCVLQAQAEALREILDPDCVRRLVISQTPMEHLPSPHFLTFRLAGDQESIGEAIGRTLADQASGQPLGEIDEQALPVELLAAAPRDERDD